MNNDVEKIKKLREKTGAGMMDCKEALSEAKGDIEKAIEFLRKKGIALASKKSSRAAKEGIIASYIHMNHRVGVLVEVNSETDFVARNEEFKKFVKEITMQIAAACPFYISRDDVPKEELDKEIEIIKEQNKDKPAQSMDKIIHGRLEKFYKEYCLLEQPFIKDESIDIKTMLTDLIGKIGENIVIRRFARYQLGEEI